MGDGHAAGALCLGGSAGPPFFRMACLRNLFWPNPLQDDHGQLIERATLFMNKVSRVSREASHAMAVVICGPR